MSDVNSGAGSAARSILPCVGDRDLVDDDVGRGHHVIGQRSGHPGADPFDGHVFHGFAGHRGEVADQAVAHAGQLADHHHGPADTGVDRDRRSHVAELDAEAADLHLLVSAAQELDVAVGIAPGDVTRPVQPPARRERVSDEPLGRQRRPTEVSVRHMCSADVDLADYADGHRLQRVIEQVQSGY